MKKSLYIVTLLISVLAAAPCFAGGKVPFVRDLQADAADARAHGTPILVMFSAESCPFCQTVLSDYIVPMSDDPAYAKKVIVRVVDVDATRSITDFSGHRIFPSELADRYGVTLTPVIKFFDASGRELAPELLGFTSEDFYGYYLDARIDQSLTKLRRRADRANLSAAPSV
jgi:thioredoxin-related protein